MIRGKLSPISKNLARYVFLVGIISTLTPHMYDTQWLAGKMRFVMQDKAFKALGNL